MTHWNVKMQLDNVLHQTFSAKRKSLSEIKNRIIIVNSEDDDPHDFLRKIKNQEYYRYFDDTNSAQTLSFTKSLSFDKSKSYLYGIGDTQFFIFDIEKAIWKVFEIDYLAFSKIFDIKIQPLDGT